MFHGSLETPRHLIPSDAGDTMVGPELEVLPDSTPQLPSLGLSLPETLLPSNLETAAAVLAIAALIVFIALVLGRLDLWYDTVNSLGYSYGGGFNVEPSNLYIYDGARLILKRKVYDKIIKSTGAPRSMSLLELCESGAASCPGDSLSAYYEVMYSPCGVKGCGGRWVEALKIEAGGGGGEG